MDSFTNGNSTLPDPSFHSFSNDFKNTDFQILEEYESFYEVVQREVDRLLAHKEAEYVHKIELLNKKVISLEQSLKKFQSWFSAVSKLLNSPTHTANTTPKTSKLVELRNFVHLESKMRNKKTLSVDKHASASDVNMLKNVSFCFFKHCTLYDLLWLKLTLIIQNYQSTSKLLTSLSLKHKIDYKYSVGNLKTKVRFLKCLV
jgi:hypothetical protein